MERQNSRRRRGEAAASHMGEEIQLQEVDMRHENKRKHTHQLRPWYCSRRVLLFFLVLVSAPVALFVLLSRYPDLYTNGLKHLPFTHNGSNVASLNHPLHPADHTSRAPRLLTHTWTITAASHTSDGVLKRIYLINGAFPGPTIEARSGDTLRIHVANHLPDGEGVSLHWHGLHLRGANDMDGAVGFTQCPIPAGGSFTYEFRVEDDQAGTFWYHSHFEEQRADGLYGGLVVHRPGDEGELESERYAYDEERLLLVGDWFHRPAGEVLSWYMSSRSFGNEPVPDSLLLNGHGAFNCSMAVPARPLNCTDLLTSLRPSMELRRDQRYRLRVVNTGAVAGITLSIPGARMKVIQVDGGNEIVDAKPSDSIGILYPGERVDLILQWEDPNSPESSELVITLDDETMGYPNPALTKTQSFPIHFPGQHRSSLPPGTPPPPLTHHFDLSTATFPPAPSLPALADETLVVYTTTSKLAKLHNIPHGFMNRTSWQPQADPSLPLISLPRRDWDKNQLVPAVAQGGGEGKWVEIVINNVDEKGHPFHLHGFDVYVLSTHRSTYGYGSYNPFDTSRPAPGGAYNLANPPRKDTVYVPRRGYAVLRFRADSEGVWMLHCHILVHQASGMAMGVQVLGDGEEGVFVGEATREKARALCDA